MELHVYLAFVVATTIMIALPGPSVLLTVAHSISFGWKNALSTVAGATMGIAVQLIVAAIGLTSLLLMSTKYTRHVLYWVHENKRIRWSQIRPQDTREDSHPGR